MNLTLYQEAVSRGLFTRDGVDPIPHLALGLAGEAGEVADIIKKSQYENGYISVPRLLEECGDVLWYLTHLVGRYGFTLEEIASMNIEKLAERHPGLYGKWLALR